jgi:hypothetical protein
MGSLCPINGAGRITQYRNFIIIGSHCPIKVTGRLRNIGAIK